MPIHILVVMDILERPKDEVERLMGDTLRVLGLSMGRLWFQEMKLEIEAFRRTLERESEVNERLLKEAIRRLEGMGLVTAESKIRATYGGGEPDLLIGSTDFPVLLMKLREDEQFRRYKKTLEEVFGI
jgi:hypothetical protein